MLGNLSHEVRQYLIITANYWAFTITDGALRMLVVLYFHQLGYSPLQIAMLFIFYELFGVITNLLGGWLGARLGLNRTMNIGLGLQLVALAMLMLPSAFLTVAWVMAAQALSGVAKDLNKMSAKSAIKLLVPENAEGTLYRWVALLTGSKNSLKGLGFFFGGALLMLIGFRGAIGAMLATLLVVWLMSLVLLKTDLGRAKHKPKISNVFSKSSAINRLSAARMFLFAARDVWFVVALPVFLSTQFDWSHWKVGIFMACWIIAYGLVQTQAPRFTRDSKVHIAALPWVAALATATITIAILGSIAEFTPMILVTGLLIFGAIFAVNSSLHSFLIVHYSNRDAVSLDVGFYYMANASGRLLGTVLSGLLYQVMGLVACLWVSSLFLLIATVLSIKLPAKVYRANQ